MTSKKTHVLSIRISEELKESLEKEADARVMDLSQYAKYLLMSRKETQYSGSQKEYKCLYWLEENYKLIGRMIIEGYFKTDAIANNKLDEEYVESIVKLANKIFKKQGIEKKEEEKYW